jgi:hypothetical protein
MKTPSKTELTDPNAVPAEMPAEMPAWFQPFAAPFTGQSQIEPLVGGNQAAAGAI